MIKGINYGKPISDGLQGKGIEFDTQHLAPRSNWSEMQGSEHFVQFYEADGFLVDSLTGFVVTGLGAGDACIVVATKAHRDRLKERLQGFGLDVDAARACGQYVSMDAAETLSKFMVNGSPEPLRFVEVIICHQRSHR